MESVVFRTRWALLPLLLPAFGLLVFLIIPIGYVATYSLWTYSPTELMIPRATLENYSTFLTDSYSRSALLRTIQVALATTAITLVLGYSVAYRMARSGAGERGLLTLAAISSLIVSEVVLAYAWFVLLAPYSGLAGEGLRRLGLLNGPLELMYTNPAIVLGLVQANLVLMILALYPAIGAIDPMYVRVAASLGASPTYAFTRITFPLSLPGILSGSVLVFAASCSAFAIPLLLGGNQVPVLSSYIYQLNSIVLNWPLASAAAVILLLIIALSLYILLLTVSRLLRRLGLS